jgi:hypothetical protein
VFATQTLSYATTAKNRIFNDTLLESIDATLNSISVTAKTAIYFRLKDAFGIQRQDIPKEIPIFLNALEDMFGLGARHLETLFVKKLYSKIEITRALTNYHLIVSKSTFEEYIDFAHECFESTRDNEEKNMAIDIFSKAPNTNHHVEHITRGKQCSQKTRKIGNSLCLLMRIRLSEKQNLP